MKRVILAATILLTFAGQLFAQDYRVRNLGTLGGASSSASALNGPGEVAGSFQLPGSNNVHAFLWTLEGGMQDLGTVGGSSSSATAINDAGQVAGQSSLVGDLVTHAFRWTQEEGMQDLGSLFDPGLNSVAVAINRAGYIVGGAQKAKNSSYHPFLWTAMGGMQDLGTLGGDWSASTPLALNDFGQVAGSSFLPSGTRHAFLWDPKTGIQDLGTLPGGTGSEAFAISNSGEVVGESFTNAANTIGHAFRWTPSTGMQDLGTLGGDFSQALFINSSSAIAGASDPAPQIFHPFLWTTDSGMQDLGTLPGRKSCFPLGLNDRGQVFGTCPTTFVWSSEAGMKAVRFGSPTRGGFNNAGQMIGFQHKNAVLVTPVMHVGVASSQNPIHSGEPLTFTATIVSVQGPPPDGELVRFTDGSKLLGTIPLVEGVASLTTSTLRVGSRPIRATYLGDSNYISARSAVLAQVVNP